MVGAIGLGAMALIGAYGPVDEDTSVQIVRRAIDHDVSLVDTAGFYSGGENERLIGRAIAGRRARTVISTKYRLPPGSGADAIAAAVHESLERLGVDSIDLLYPARIDRTVPIEETVGAMAQLVAAGTVRFIGLCEAAPETIGRAHAVHPLAAVQTEYSLFTRDPEREVLPTLRELGIGLVAYCPLARGLLTGSLESAADIGPWRSKIPRFAGENLPRNLALAQVVKQVADARGASASQVALAWLLHQGPDIVPIPGTRNPARLDENLAAAEVRLDPEALARLDDAFTPGAAAGDRYPPEGMRTLGG